MGQMIEWNILIKTVAIFFFSVFGIFFSFVYFLHSKREKQSMKINIEKNMKDINSISINELNKMSIQSKYNLSTN